MVYPTYLGGGGQEFHNSRNLYHRKMSQEKSVKEGRELDGWWKKLNENICNLVELLEEIYTKYSKMV